MFAVAFGTDTEAIVANPVLLVAPLTLVVCTAILSTALMRSDVHHRSETVIDPLTGMLNRKALATRVAELEQQSLVSGEPIGLVVGDLDRFKEVNDSCGHATGRRGAEGGGLRDAQGAARLRPRLPAGRRGVPRGAARAPTPPRPSGWPSGCARSSRACSFSGDQRLTMSFGVSASPRGGQFEYQDVFGEADMALFEAKRSGRDRVVPRRRGARPRAGPAR